MHELKTGCRKKSTIQEFTKSISVTLDVFRADDYYIHFA